MAFPPTIPPNNRTNATLLADNHPGDHNAIADALTDIVGATDRCGGHWTDASMTLTDSVRSALVFDVEQEDTGGFGAPGGSVFTIPAGKAGIYTIQAAVVFTSGNTPQGFIEIVAGGGTHRNAYAAPSGTASGFGHYWAVSVAGLSLTAGQTIEAYILPITSGSGSYTINSFIQIWRVAV